MATVMAAVTQKKTPAKPRNPKPTAIAKAYKKTEIVREIAENSGLTNQEVGAVLDELGVLIHRHVKKRAAGTFTLPGLLKIVTTEKPATKKRKGINPFTGEETIFAAKPAQTVVKVRPLKKLKDMAQT